MIAVNHTSDTRWGYNVSYLRGNLPKGVNSATGSRFNIKGVRGESINIPIHRVNIKLKVISETIDVGIVSKLPMLMGNGLEGGKV